MIDINRLKKLEKELPRFTVNSPLTEIISALPSIIRELEASRGFIDSVKNLEMGSSSFLRLELILAAYRKARGDDGKDKL